MAPTISKSSADFKASNMAILEKVYPDLFRMLDEYEPNAIGQIIETKSVPSFEFELSDGRSLPAYNIKDPWKDAETYLDLVRDGDTERTCVFVGMGLGYGPLLILEKRPVIPKIVIIEPSVDLFCIAMQNVDLSPLILSHKVTFFVGAPDWDHYKCVVRPFCKGGAYLLLHAICIAWAPEIYKPVKEKAEILIYSVSSSVKTLNHKGPSFFENRLKNLTLLRHCHLLDTLKGVFNGFPAILVSAGPSLTESLPLLKKAVGRCIIIAVDSALSPLLGADIYPDFVTASDNLPINYEKVAPFATQRWPFSLVTNLSVNPRITKQLMAANLFFSFEKKDEPHTWLSEGLGVRTVVPSGSSVVHLSLSLAQVMGADPIILIGHDFSYTSDRMGHAANVVIASHALSDDSNKDTWFMTQDIHGGQVKTQLSYLEFKTFFEEMIRSEPRTYINASVAGAHIEGTQVVDFETVLRRYLGGPVSVGQQLREALTQAMPLDVTGFIREGQPLLLAAQEKKCQIENTISLINTVQETIKVTGPDYFIAKDISDLPSELRIETETLIRSIQLSEISLGDKLQQYISELVGETYVLNEEKIIENQKKLGNSFTAWFESELARLESLNQSNWQALDQFTTHLEKLLDHLIREEEFVRRGSESGNMQDSLLPLVDLYYESGDYGIAKNLLDKAVSCWPDSAEIWYRIGMIQAGCQDYQPAIESWNRAFEIDHDFKERIEEARNLEIQKLLKKMSKHRHMNLHRKMLKLFLVIGEGTDWAITELGKLWRDDYAHMEKELSKGETEWVHQWLEGWEDYSTLFSGWHVIKAKCSAALNDMETAVLCLKTAVSMEPHNPEWLILLARYSFITGKNDQGVLYLQKAASIDHQKAALWEELGDSLLVSKDYTSAAAAYQECISALPERTEVLWKMGDCYLLGRLPHQARAVYNLLLKRNMNHTVAKDRLSQAFEMIGELESDPSKWIPSNRSKPIS